MGYVWRSSAFRLAEASKIHMLGSNHVEVITSELRTHGTMRTKVLQSTAPITTAILDLKGNKLRKQWVITAKFTVDENFGLHRIRS
eukprot:5470256-Amphidinium_carterae.1